jgi:hypothetical protein
MCGESVINTTGARGALSAVNADALQGHASMGFGSARAALVPAAAHAATAKAMAAAPVFNDQRRMIGKNHSIKKPWEALNHPRL